MWKRLFFRSNFKFDLFLINVNFLIYILNKYLMNKIKYLCSLTMNNTN